MVTELFRAGLRDAAEGLLRVTVVRNPMGPSRPTQRSDVEWLAAEAGQRIQPELADRIAQAERLSERAKWPTFHTPNGALQWSQALEGDAAHPERVAGLLALLSDVPAETRVSLLLAAARGDAKHGRFDEAAARLAQATTLLAPMDRPYEPFCRAMAQAARLGRGDLADMAFRASVAAARGEPEAVRAAILLDAAACRAASANADYQRQLDRADRRQTRRADGRPGRMRSANNSGNDHGRDRRVEERMRRCSQSQRVETNERSG